MKDKLLKIINHYGVNHQLRKFQEEVFELNEAIIKNECDEYKDIKSNINHIAEEIADCFVMIEQFIEYYKIDNNDILKILEEKIDRQLKRIEDEDKI